MLQLRALSLESLQCSLFLVAIKCTHSSVINCAPRLSHSDLDVDESFIHWFECFASRLFVNFVTFSASYSRTMNLIYIIKLYMLLFMNLNYSNRFKYLLILSNVIELIRRSICSTIFSTSNLNECRVFCFSALSDKEFSMLARTSKKLFWNRNICMTSCADMCQSAWIHSALQIMQKLNWDMQQGEVPWSCLRFYLLIVQACNSHNSADRSLD